LGDRDIVLAKEMTKVFEEVKRGSVSKILALLNDGNVKGEYTIIVEGPGKRERHLSLVDN